jgi:kynurenine formamidase
LTSKREITGIAVDTPSIDYGKSKDFKVHQILCGAGKLALENIANLDKLPPSGAILYVIPMMIKDGTGAPARVFAILP